MLEDICLLSCLAYVVVLAVGYKIGSAYLRRGELKRKRKALDEKAKAKREWRDEQIKMFQQKH